MRRDFSGGEDPDEPRAREDQDRMRQIQRHRQARAAKTIFLLAILTILILFIVWNAHDVEVNYVFFKANNGLIWVMLACAILGGIIGFIVGRPGRAFRFRHEEDDGER